MLVTDKINFKFEKSIRDIRNKKSIKIKPLSIIFWGDEEKHEKKHFIINFDGKKEKRGIAGKKIKIDNANE